MLHIKLLQQCQHFSVVGGDGLCSTNKQIVPCLCMAFHKQQQRACYFPSCKISLGRITSYPMDLYPCGLQQSFSFPTKVLHFSNSFSRKLLISILKHAVASLLGISIVYGSQIKPQGWQCLEAAFCISLSFIYGPVYSTFQHVFFPL